MVLLIPATNSKSDRQSELEKQVTPSRSASTVTTKSSNSSSKIYSERDLTNAWTKVRTLNTQGKYDDAEKLEAELSMAYMEGRVK